MKSKIKALLFLLGIISGSLLLLLILTGFGIYIYYNGFKPKYSTGGILSENQAKYDVTFYDINLEVIPENKSISGNTKIEFISTSDDLDLLEADLIDNYKIDSVIVNSSHTDFVRDRNKIWISLPNIIPKNELSSVNIYYSGIPPEALRPPWLGGFSWEKDDEGNDWIGLSCQGEGAKIWFPCKDHPTDEADSAAINITVPQNYKVAANGLLKYTSKPREGFTTFHWFTGYPINNYLINFGVGQFTETRTEYIAEDGTSVPVVFYVLPEMQDGAQELVNETVIMLKSYRKFFGEYPWKNEKCGLLNSPFAGMEHQTLIAYGNYYRRSYINGFSYDELLLHELAHEWWGNKITVRDWSDFWIQEGFATYSESLYLLDQQGETAYHESMEMNNRRIRNSDPIKPPAHATSIEAYQSDIYTKGAAFLHSLRYVLGDSVFFLSLKQFATDSIFYRYGVTTNDFLQLVNNNSGKDLSDLFKLYLETTNLPEVVIDSVATNTFQIVIPNVNFEIPMDVMFEDRIEQIYLGPDTIEIASTNWPIVDPLNWYLKD